MKSIVSVREPAVAAAGLGQTLFVFVSVDDASSIALLLSYCVSLCDPVDGFPYPGLGRIVSARARFHAASYKNA
jgi:hypothetical protein